MKKFLFLFLFFVGCREVEILDHIEEKINACTDSVVADYIAQTVEPDQSSEDQVEVTTLVLTPMGERNCISAKDIFNGLIPISVLRRSKDYYCKIGATDILLCNYLESVERN